MRPRTLGTKFVFMLYSKSNCVKFVLKNLVFDRNERKPQRELGTALISAETRVLAMAVRYSAGNGGKVERDVDGASKEAIFIVPYVMETIDGAVSKGK